MTMSEPLSRREMRRRLLPALREALHDPAVWGMVADMLDDHESTVARTLREHPDVYAAMSALHYGCWRCQEVLRKCRSLIAHYTQACYRLRRGGVTHPESITGGRGDNFVATDRERSGRSALSRGWPYVASAAEEQEGRTLRHVRLLVYRGFAGHDVPPDVGVGLDQLREDLRECILTGKGVWRA